MTKSQMTTGSRTSQKLVNVLKNKDWIFGSLLFAVCLYHLWALGSVTEYLSVEKVHQLFPLALSSISLLCYYCKVANIGHIDIYLDSRYNIITGGVPSDVECQARGNHIYKVRKIHVVQYVCWLMCWPLLIFTLETYSSGRDCMLLLENIESLILKVILVEALVSSMLISSFTYNFIKCVFAAVSFAIEIYVIICVNQTLATANVTVLYFVLPTFQAVWLLYVTNWIVSEGFNIMADETKEMLWGVFDMVHFAVIPLVLAVSGAR